MQWVTIVHPATINSREVNNLPTYGVSLIHTIGRGSSLFGQTYCLRFSFIVYFYIYRQLTRRYLKVSEFSSLRNQQRGHTRFSHQRFPLQQLVIRIPSDLQPSYLCLKPRSRGPAGMEPEFILIAVTLVSYYQDYFHEIILPELPIDEKGLII